MVQVNDNGILSHLSNHNRIRCVGTPCHKRKFHPRIRFEAGGKVKIRLALLDNQLFVSLPKGLVSRNSERQFFARAASNEASFKSGDNVSRNRSRSP